MSFDRARLAALVAEHGRVWRVVVAEARGSVPREPGAAMLLWEGPDGPGQEGTIGGGTLEWEAAKSAREGRARRLAHLPLGPAMGQCCGGAVTLLTECWDAEALAALDTEAGLAARGPGNPPLAISRALAEARRGTPPARPVFAGEWFAEALAPPRRPLWIWGAGHVGRALVATLAPLPDFAITWIDTAPERFPSTIPDGVTRLPAADPALAAAHAPQGAEHLVLTYSHAIDLALCDALLRRGFARAGLIGSATKWARFRKRLAELGHGPAAIETIKCPIGDPALGKHPQAIAIGVAAALLRSGAGADRNRNENKEQDDRNDRGSDRGDERGIGA